MLHALKTLRRFQREDLALREMPVAQLTALLANINRDPSKRKEFTTQEFCIFRDQQPSEELGISPEVAAVALELRHQQIEPEILLTVWPQVLAAATRDARVPRVRALRTDDGTVWVLAPRWEESAIRAGLVLVRGAICGRVLLRDLDRPLLAYTVALPKRSGYGWIEAGTLLMTELER